MLKPTANYKMSGQLKRSLALSKNFQDPHKKGQWKRAMIDAELSAAIAPKKEKKPRGSGNFTQTDSESN